MKTRTIDNTEALKRIADKAKEIKQEKEGVTMTIEKETATTGNSDGKKIMDGQVFLLQQDRQANLVLQEMQDNLQLCHFEEPCDTAKLRIHANKKAVLEESQIRIQHLLPPNDNS